MTPANLKLSFAGKVFWLMLIASAAIFFALGGPTYLRIVKLNLKLIVLGDLGRQTERVRYAEEQLQLARSRLGDSNLLTRIALSMLAALYEQQGRIQDALDLRQQELHALRDSLGPVHRVVAETHPQIANLLFALGRGSEAELHLKEALELSEKAEGANSERYAQTIELVGLMLRVNGREEEGDRLLARSEAIRAASGHLAKERQPLDHASAGLRALNAGRVDDSIRELELAVAGYERRYGPTHPDLLLPLSGLSTAFARAKRPDRAVGVMTRALTIAEAAYGKDHLVVADTLGSLAMTKEGLATERIAESFAHNTGAALPEDVQKDIARLRAEALPLRQRALAILETSLPQSHPKLGQAQVALAGTLIGLDRKVEAFPLLLSGIEIQVAAQSTEADLDKPSREAGLLATAYWQTLDLGPQLMMTRATAVDDTFRIAQIATRSSASAALAQTAARAGASSTQLAELARKRQDLVRLRQRYNSEIFAAVSQPTSSRDRANEARLQQALTGTTAALESIDRQLTESFPRFSALSMQRAVSIENVQALLGEGEVLLQYYVPTSRGLAWSTSAVWAIGKHEARLVRLPIRGSEVEDAVAALRCGLDENAWLGDAAVARCNKLLETERDTFARSSSSPLRFSPQRARALYTALFEGIGDLTHGKQLLVVPSGPLSALPLQVLIEEPVTPGTSLRDLAWLGTRQAITVLPSVGSLAALRSSDRQVRRADRPYLGVGNPLLSGGADETAKAQTARSIGDCEHVSPIRIAQAAQAHAPASGLVRGGLANLRELEALSPLPETAQELCEVASSIKAESSDVRLGTQATESAIKDLSAQGLLARYRVLHFATHGALSGEIDGASEPGLVLTPPSSPSTRDDGYLSASEISELDLDADWVILSACNTAGGSGDGTASLSGIARAFFYAGARALLASHWAVSSSAAVTLTTHTFALLARDPRVGSAEALRSAMASLVAGDKPFQAHPSYWAPFVVVGEARRQAL